MLRLIAARTAQSVSREKMSVGIMPSPPRAMVMPADLQSIMILVSTALIVTAGIWALYRIFRHGDGLPATLMVGGLLIYFAVEPFYDLLGFVYHPEIGQVSAFTALGRALPLHLLLLYVPYWALLAYYFIGKFEKGVTDRWIWIAFWAWTPGQVLFETPLLMQGLWSYYGDTPFKIGYYPLWLAPATAGSAILSFALVFWVRKIIPRLWTPVLSVVMSSGCAAGCLVTGWPIFLALNMDRTISPSGLLLTVPATIASIALSAGCVWISLQILKIARTIDAPATTSGAHSSSGVV